MMHHLEPLFRPPSVVFIGGSNLNPVLKYHRDLGFAGETWMVNPKYETLQGYPCFADIDDLPSAPDLAFIAIRREAAIEAVESLRARGCKAIVCNAAGFAEVGGSELQAQLVAAAGDMVMLGPNAVGLVNSARARPTLPAKELRTRLALLLRYGFLRTDLGDQIEHAVERTLAAGVRTPDLGGQNKSSDVVEAVLRELR